MSNVATAYPWYHQHHLKAYGKVALQRALVVQATAQTEQLVCLELVRDYEFVLMWQVGMCTGSWHGMLFVGGFEVQVELDKRMQTRMLCSTTELLDRCKKKSHFAVKIMQLYSKTLDTTLKISIWRRQQTCFIFSQGSFKIAASKILYNKSF